MTNLSFLLFFVKFNHFFSCEIVFITGFKLYLYKIFSSPRLSPFKILIIIDLNFFLIKIPSLMFATKNLLHPAFFKVVTILLCPPSP